MSVSGASFNSSLASTRSFAELPNLPGVRRDISSANPKLYKEFKRSQLASSRATASNNEFLLGGDFDDENADNMSFRSSSQKSMLLIEDINKVLTPFSGQASQYNDISGRYGLVSQKRDKLNKSMSLPFCSLDSVSSFVSGAKHVYRIVAIYDEETPENLLELFRTRKVEIICHSEDGSIEIMEPRTPNASLLQGKILKRHKVMKPAPNKRQALQSIGVNSDKEPQSSSLPYFTVDDFFKGAKPVIYGREYFVVDADNATRNYFKDVHGKDFGPALPLPASFYQPQTKQQIDALKRASSPSKKAAVNAYGQLSKSYKAAAFFTHANKTLRFIGIWDNRSEMFGDKIFVKIHYTLKDHQIEVIPLVERNSGRDKLSVLLKKTTLLKRPTALDVELQENSISDSTITHSQFTGLIHTPSTEDLQKVLAPRPYNWDDLYIGLNLTMASTYVTFIDADEFTREFYKSQGKPLGEPLTDLIAADVHPGVTKAAENTEVDPAKNPGFLPLNPPKDGAKLKLYQGLILRYEARLANPKPADVSRVFILQVHLEDDSIQIREPPQRNTGHQGGIFLARNKFESKDLGRYLLPEDIAIGKSVQIMSFKFEVYGADEYTLKYMETNETRWGWSDIKLVTKKLAPKIEVIKRLVLSTPNIQSVHSTYDEVFDLLQAAGVDVIKQESLTLCRFLDPMREGKVKLSKLLKVIIDNSK